VEDDGMAIRAVVREWHDDEGWGVLDAPAVPGGCWAGFGQVAISGYRSLRAGQGVALEWERGEQDGYDFRAVAVRPLGTEPVRSHPTPGDGAYSSTLTLTFDADES
jgi:CspA family cold shock protein